MRSPTFPRQVILMGGLDGFESALPLRQAAPNYVWIVRRLTWQVARRPGRQGSRPPPRSRTPQHRPANRRSSRRWAKMHSDLATALGGTNEFCRHSGDFDTADRVESICAERRASSPLASQTVTQRSQLWRLAERQSQSAAGALGIGHGNSSRLRGEIALDGGEAQARTANGQGGRCKGAET